MRNIILIILISTITLSCAIFESKNFSFNIIDEKHPLALSFLPKTDKGYVDWVAAMDKKIIEPAESIKQDTQGNQPLELDIIFNTKDEYPVPDVIFPHKPHTAWLGCNNCHPTPFIMKAGANPVTMAGILKGEFCGKCHGKVAFTLSDCFRCHSKKKNNGHVN